jgi:hypothetical protein
MENNLVYNTRTGGFHQHYGRENLIRNNIFAFSMEGQIQRTRVEEHVSFTLERNIIIYNRGTLFSGRGVADDKVVLRGNCYWRTDGEPVRFGDKTLAEWQAAGKDAGSVVADPKFADAERGDFRLAPDSPALTLGFVPFDYMKAGVYGDPAWVALAASVAYPPVEFAPPAPPPPPLTFEDGFETGPLGSPPVGATVRTEGKGAGVGSSDKAAAAGKRSLRMVDAPGLPRSYYPLFHYEPRHSGGVTRLSFDVRPDAATVFFVEWRDKASPYRVGPSLHVRGGKVLAGGKTLLEVPTDAWTHIEITCGLGPQATGTWDLVVTPADRPPQTFRGLPCRDAAAWKSLDWLGFVSDAQAATTLYLDNIALSHTPAAP